MFLADCSLSIRSDFFDAVNLLVGGENLSMPLSRNLSGVHSGLHELVIRRIKEI
jgi:hypothetical protein